MCLLPAGQIDAPWATFERVMQRLLGWGTAALLTAGYRREGRFEIRLYLEWIRSPLCSRRQPHSSITEVREHEAHLLQDAARDVDEEGTAHASQ